MTDNPYEASQVSAEEPDTPPENAPKIEGWLLLPPFGMIFGPLLYIVALVREFSNGYLELVREIDADFPGFQTAWAVVTICELLLIGFQLYTVFRYFKRHVVVPRLMIFMLVVNVGLAILSSLWFHSIFGALDEEDIIAIFRAVLVACVWIPYFIFSKRVKATFIVDSSSEQRFNSDEH